MEFLAFIPQAIEADWDADWAPRLDSRSTSVMASTSGLRYEKAVRDAVQHLAAQELAVDVDELRVRADRAGAGH